MPQKFERRLFDHGTQIRLVLLVGQCLATTRLYYWTDGSGLDRSRQTLRIQIGAMHLEMNKHVNTR